MSYSLIELILFILAFLAGYYGMAHFTETGKPI